MDGLGQLPRASHRGPRHQPGAGTRGKSYTKSAVGGSKKCFNWKKNLEQEIMHQKATFLKARWKKNIVVCFDPAGESHTLSSSWPQASLYGKTRPFIARQDTREYILEKKHIHVINVVRFVPNRLLKIQFKSILLMFSSFRKLKTSAFLWFHQVFYTLHNDL